LPLHRISSSDTTATIHQLSSIMAEELYIRLPAVRARPNDVVIGWWYMPRKSDVGNEYFSRFIWTRIERAHNRSARDYFKDWEQTHLLFRQQEDTEEFRYSMFRETIYYFAVSKDEIVMLSDTNPLLLSFVRQMIVYTIEAALGYTEPDQTDVINYAELRALWFSKHLPGTLPHLFLRVWEECPTRDDILNLCILKNVQDPESGEIILDKETADLVKQRRNTYEMLSGCITLRRYKTFNIYGVQTITLSLPLKLQLNHYLEGLGMQNGTYPVQDRLRLVFGNSTVVTVKTWANEAGGLDGISPLKTASNAISGLRKALTSFCADERRLPGEHIHYGETATQAFPGAVRMRAMQLHAEQITDDFYTYSVRPILRVPS
jgi:hypothetical protein